MEIGLPVLEKISKGFLPYMGMAAILVMCPASCHQIFISLYLKAFIQNLVQIGKVVPEKILFEFYMYTTLDQGQVMTLTFNTHIPSYIQLDVCTYQLSGSLAAIVSEKSTVFTFSYRNPMLLNLTLP